MGLTIGKRQEHEMNVLGDQNVILDGTVEGEVNGCAREVISPLKLDVPGGAAHDLSGGNVP